MISYYTPSISIADPVLGDGGFISDNLAAIGSGGYAYKNNLAVNARVARGYRGWGLYSGFGGDGAVPANAIINAVYMTYTVSKTYTNWTALLRGESNNASYGPVYAVNSYYSWVAGTLVTTQSFALGGNATQNQAVADQIRTPLTSFAAIVRITNNYSVAVSVRLYDLFVRIDWTPYVPSPTLSSISPVALPAYGQSVKVDCYGSNFSSATTHAEQYYQGAYHDMATGYAGTTNVFFYCYGYDTGTNYVRIHRTDSSGAQTSSNVAFQVPVQIVLPSVSTVLFDEVTQTSVRGVGSCSDLGNGVVDDMGICVDTFSPPTTQRSVGYGGITTFQQWATGLYPGTVYYLRAYAHNQAGTQYGNTLSFTTAAIVVAPTVTTSAATLVTDTTATISGSCSSNGGGTVTAKGMMRGTSPSPTEVVGTPTAGTGAISVALTGLTPGTTYYARAFATNEAGTVYGADVSFLMYAAPTVAATTAATAITETTATTGGNVTANGGSAILTRGVCYGTSSLPTTANSFVAASAATGSFASNLGGLAPGTTYYVRAYASNPYGLVYGAEISFTTTSTILSTRARVGKQKVW